METRKTVMASMRQLGFLFLAFKAVDSQVTLSNQANGSATEPNASEMFQRKNFLRLESAIEAFTKNNDGSLKTGKKISLFYLLKKAAKILKGTYLVQDNESAARDVENFVQVLDYNSSIVFGDTTYELNKSKNTNLRKPQRMPEEADIQKVRQHNIQVVQRLTSDEYMVWDQHDFKALRDAVVCRLTLYNASRGGEPSRMTLQE